MFYSFVYFCIGGLIYLYKDSLDKMSKKSLLGIFVFMCAIIVLFYNLQIEYILTFEIILVFSLLLILAINTENNKMLSNKIASFISKISMEIYLSHMLIFRIIEKLHLTKIFENNYMSFFTTTVIVTVCTIIFALGYNKITEIMKLILSKKIKLKKEIQI